ncbi:peptidoglycan recognition protein family protein [Anaerorhabdus furcosa]|uniref:N-acetylmuramoyl-L-alanine amidase n=1 Tax=Anaerorhabdus furcosa TaxID=118967 RepID=A0A1T4LS12_9FIRM|nr:N-acetylmuramoyl-L-alanine amidase [Anaerorhabdus furcosa]SJZ57475.1 N-acetylmuramoyl-L-alanine amidase [Anaerorhabdus furcosa]
MEIIQQLISQDKYGLKCPYVLNPKYITIHNTGNNASAQNEINYMKKNLSNTSFHIAVDDKVAILGIPLNRNAWHAGDGSKGIGNRESIGIEICYSTDYSSDRHSKAFYNAIEVTKQLMIEFNIPIENVRQHYDWSKKNCPHRIRKEGTWKKFLSLCCEAESIETHEQKLKRIRVEKEGLYIREKVNGEIIGFIPENSFQDFDLIMFVKGIQSDGFQHCKVQGSWIYNGLSYENKIGDIQFDSRVYSIEESE